MLIKRAIVFELIRQIENHVGLKALQFLAKQIEVVEDGEMFCFVAKFFQRGENIRLRFPIVGFQLRAQVLIDGRRRDGIEERENF